MGKRKRGKEAGEGAQGKIPNGEPDRHHGVDPKKKDKSKHVGAARESEKEEQKEGFFLLGDPSFVDLGNGRARCVESGHELLSRDQEAYGHSKACRLALIDAAVARKKPPLNMFEPHPTSKSQLVCKLTGDHVNKAEEHIWKHMSGKKFQKRLEQKEIEKHTSAAVGEKEKKQSRKEQKELEKHAGAVVEQKGKKQSKSERKGMEKKDAITEIVEKDKNQLKSDLGASRKDQVKNTYGNQKLSKIKPNSGDDEEPYFWEPPGSRWDFDDGKDRWDLNTNSADKADDDGTLEKDDSETGEPIKKSKQKKSTVRPVDLASKKKKIKKSTKKHSISSS